MPPADDYCQELPLDHPWTKIAVSSAAEIRVILMVQGRPGRWSRVVQALAQVPSGIATLTCAKTI